MQICRAPVRPAAVLAAYALAGLLGPGACREVSAPLPPGAVRFPPPASYARWWALTEGCAGRTGDLAAYAWYAVPGTSVPDSRRGDVSAYTDVTTRRIVIATHWRGDGPTVRHEMLHALLGPAYASGGPAAQHPPAYFQGGCVGVVACPDVGCRDAGPAPVPAPADAPMLPLSALDVRVDVLPDRVSRTGPDGVFSVVVRVTNPSAEPVRVPLEATPDLPAPWVRGYGFRIVPAGAQLPIAIPAQSDSAGMVTSDSVRRVPFGAGQTRQLVIDMPARLYPAGAYLTVGVFNGRQVSARLTVDP